VPPSPEEIHERLLAGFQNEPFTEALARFLAAEPAAEYLRAWAQKNPDRWAQAVASLARLSGMEHAQDAAIRIGTLNVLAVSKMSDSELIAGLQRLMAEAGHEVGLPGTDRTTNSVGSSGGAGTRDGGALGIVGGEERDQEPSEGGQRR
jgi:hypothetical protein